MQLLRAFSVRGPDAHKSRIYAHRLYRDTDLLIFESVEILCVRNRHSLVVPATRIPTQIHLRVVHKLAA